MNQPDPADSRGRFNALLAASLEIQPATGPDKGEEGGFIGLVLSKPHALPPEHPDLRRIDVRPIVLKGEQVLSFRWHFERRDETHNLPVTRAFETIASMIESWFANADLETTSRTWSLRTSRKGSTSLIRGKRKDSVQTDTSRCCTTSSHNRAKERPIAADSLWLRQLKLADERGELIPRMMDKYRQINKFVEVLAALVDESRSPTAGEVEDRHEALRILDMGSGKGYLTFAAHDWFSRHFAPTTRGIEYRPDLVDLCNAASREAGMHPALSFQAGSIADAHAPQGPGDLVVIALHACDTATDDALYFALNAGARIIICSPCCHKQVRRALSPAADIQAITRFGILEERLAELLTDAIRALILEAAGYKVKVFEFVDREHSGKNLMITATRPNGRRPLGRRPLGLHPKDQHPTEQGPQNQGPEPAFASEKLAEARALCTRFGVASQYLLDRITTENMEKPD